MDLMALDGSDGSSSAYSSTYSIASGTSLPATGSNSGAVNHNLDSTWFGAAPAVANTTGANTLKVDHQTFESSLSEIYQFKQCISLKIKQLEQAIDRLKSLVLVYNNNNNNSDGRQWTDAEARMANQKQPTATNTPMTNGDGDSVLANQNLQIRASPSQADLIELRTILSDIDVHLAVLKDVEERHALICESYSQEIRVRDETLHGKAQQIRAMGQELAQMQSKITQLSIKNQQLESEIKQVKVHVPNPNDGIVKSRLDESHHKSIDVEKGKHHRETSSPTRPTTSRGKRDNASKAVDSTRTRFESDEIRGLTGDGNTDMNYETMYYNLLKQYRQFESMLLSAGVSRGFQETKSHSEVHMKRTEHKSTTIDMNSVSHMDATQTVEQTNSVLILDEQNELTMTNNVPLQDLEFQGQTPKKTPKKVTINLNNTKVVVPDMNSFAEPLGSELNAIKEEEEDASIDADSIAVEEKRPLLNGSTDEGFGSVDLTDTEMARTSKSAFEHFVNMQGDLQKLMKSEQTYRLRCEELEQTLGELRTAKEDDEYKLSEVTYELDILKHNYDLEMESFGSAVTERESLIEKLQQKVEALRRKYQTLDDRLQSSINKEVEYKSAIEEAEGRVTYEQLQRQTVIDARVNELELKLVEAELEYHKRTADMQSELANKAGREQDLLGRIEELENSLKNLVLSNSGGGDATGGDQLMSAEDEFAYYKNRIEALTRELETEKQERLALVDKQEEELKAKDKALELVRDQVRKDKEAQLREKNEFDQKYRKLATKFKVKEREINTLHEKLQVLNNKFKAREAGELGTMESDSVEPSNRTEENGEARSKSEEQLMTELALNELQLSELRSKLENAEEHLTHLTETMAKERERRREIESHYLAATGRRNRSKGLFWGLFGGDEDSDATKQDDWNAAYEDRFLMTAQPFSSVGGSMYGSSSPHPRNSVTSLSLLMEENYHHQLGGAQIDPDELPAQCPTVFGAIKRTLRRQKNNFIFGSTSAKAIRIALVFYLVLLHFYAFQYYME